MAHACLSTDLPPGCLSTMFATIAWGHPQCAACVPRHVQLRANVRTCATACKCKNLHAVSSQRSLPSVSPPSPAHTALLTLPGASAQDFASLYPSLYRAHNMCYTTLLHADDAAALEPAQVTTTTAGTARAPRSPACPPRALWLLRNLALFCNP